MNIVISGLLGAVQGITEFLPISSTGHLILLEYIFGISQSQYGLTFDALMHLGTLIALLYFFRNEWIKFFNSIINALFRKNKNSDDNKLALILLIATIPAALIGFLFEDKVESILRTPIVIGVSLIGFSLVLICAEEIGKKNKYIKQMNWLDGLVIGFAQAIALIPGVSRSGITIATGMWQGLTREQAAKFAFLLSAPIIAGAGVKKLFDVCILFISNPWTIQETWFYITGILSAAIFGYLTIKYFLKFLQSNTLYPFIIYRVILGATVLLYFVI